MNSTESTLDAIINDTWNNTDTPVRISSFLERHAIDDYDEEFATILA